MIVVGAGVEGSATAYHVASRGASVILLEQVRMECLINTEATYFGAGGPPSLVVASFPGFPSSFPSLLPYCTARLEG